jgi:hypothetical protein
MSACPDPETLAAFVENRLPLDRRAPIEAHLAACEDCYEVFAAAAQVVAEDAPARGALVGAGRIRPVHLLPLAAAALLALAVWPTWRRQLPTGPAASPPAPTLAAASPTPHHDPGVATRLAAVDRLFEIADPAGLARAARLARSAELGFAGTRPASGAPFRFGVARTDLDVCERAGDRECADAARARLRELPAPADTAAVEVGEWIEAARIAAAVRNSTFFDDPLRTRLREATGLSPEAAARARAAAALLEKGPASEADWGRLERTLADVVLLM